MSKAYIGIDLAARWCWGVARDESGEILGTEKLKTSEENLVAYVEAQGVRPLCPWRSAT